jgi:hypothetical protein
MANITVFMHLTLGGVMQAPGRPDEDHRGGFEYSGWTQPRGDAAIAGIEESPQIPNNGATGLGPYKWVVIPPSMCRIWPEM